MIRLGLLAAAALSVVIVLLIDRINTTEPSGAPQVTRGDTRLQSADLRTVPQAATASERLDMQMRARSVSEYRQPVSAIGGAQDPMRALTDSVLAGLGAPRVPDPQDIRLTLGALVAQAMHADQSDAYVDALLIEAGVAGAALVSGGPVTGPDKRNTVAALNALVRQSATPRIRPMARPTPPGAIAKVTPTATPAALPDAAPAAEAPLVYTVQPGDSLAGIALRHYGTTTAQDLIYRANRDKLASPSAVRPGMTLTIPTL